MKISYSWEISSSNEFGKYSNFVKLTDNTAFFPVNQSVLEPFYFRPKYRIRCISNIVKLSENSVGTANTFLTSNTIHIIAEKSLDSNKQMNCYDKEDKLLPDMNLFSSLPVSEKNIFFEQSIFARAEYISEDFRSVYKNRVKISANIAYRAGAIPLISTSPLHNCRIALTDQQNNKAHICSNFIDKSVDTIKYGFINNAFDSGNYSAMASLLSKYRDNKTKKLYSNLDLDDCEWKFTAYYDLNELLNACNSKMFYESETKEDGKHFITLKIPLYISYAQANSPSGLNCIDHKTEIDVSLQYSMHENDDATELNLVEDTNLMKAIIYKTKFDSEGRLVMDISTSTYFNGKF